MTKEEFWEILDTARMKAGGWHSMEVPLLEQLSGMKAPDIITWKQIMREYCFLACKEKMWAAAITIMDGYSNDSFIGFQGWLIAQGKEIYLSALRDPDSLVKAEAIKRFAQEIAEYPEKRMEALSGYQEKPSFEEILYIADHACECHTGEEQFDEAVPQLSLPEETLCAIASEIYYAVYIDETMDIGNLSWRGMLDCLKNSVPKLYLMLAISDVPNQQPSLLTPGIADY